MKTKIKVIGGKKYALVGDSVYSVRGSRNQLYYECKAGLFWRKVFGAL